MSTTTTTRKTILRSFDGEEFEVVKEEAMQSVTLMNMIEDGCFQGVIPVPSVRGKTLGKVVEYCRKHAGKADAESLRTWDAGFVAENSRQTVLFDLVMAANFLDIKGLLDLTTQAVADMIKDLSPDEVRIVFNVKNDFTPEEEQKVRQDNHWAFE